MPQTTMAEVAMAVGISKNTVSLIQYEWRSDHGEWAGMDQRNDLVGEAAMDMLISMVHHNERGVPEHPRATMIGSHWVGGKTAEGPRNP